MMGTRIFDYAAMSAPLEQPRACRDLVSVQDFSPEEIKSLFELTNIIKHRPADFRAALAGKQLVLFFEKASLRTRLTFEAGMASLGGATFFVDQTRSRMHDRELLRDIAHNVERWVDGVVVRTFEHETVMEIAQNSCIPVINALSDTEHPCQAFADFFTIQEKFGDLSQIHLAYVGDGNNVAHSLMLAAASLGAKFSIATPQGYEPHPQITSAALAIAATTGAQIELTHDPLAAVSGADAVYTDVWTSMGCEAEAAEREKIFAGYQVNDKLFAHAAPRAVFMHCLPAHREQEVSASVIDSPRSVVFDQAENRMHVQKAILLLLLGGGIRRGPSRSNHA
ncbi:MAG TPA: ornithine carbamoyltransferase [Candidatus Angelobacter sp.]|jgi:ornithine carbamoyltransferase|nr:ornithine carbamoyltransferase [Candidatus Angelobacter sp.]